MVVTTRMTSSHSLSSSSLSTPTLTSTTTTTSQSAFKATYPFDGSSGTRPDMILRSADGVDFRVLKGVLAVASPVFGDMSALAGPLANTSVGTRDWKVSWEEEGMISKDGIPIVVMSESAKVLDTLLRIIYPVLPPKLDDSDELDLDLVWEVLRAAQKYDMVMVLHFIEEMLRVALTSSRNNLCRGVGDNEPLNQRQRQGVRVDPMTIYILACEYRLENLTRLAVHEFLKSSSSSSEFKYFKGLERVSGSVIFQLFSYRQKVADSIDTLFVPFRNSTDVQRRFECGVGRGFLRDVECLVRNVKPNEGCGSRESGCYISAWWINLCEIVRSSGEIQRCPLKEDIVSIGRIVEAVIGIGAGSGSVEERRGTGRGRGLGRGRECCDSCKEKVLTRLDVVEESLKRDMGRLVAEVRFELPW